MSSHESHQTLATNEKSESINEDSHSHHHGYLSDKDKFLARIKRIEGQTRGVHRLISEEKYCIDILTQISALKSALDGLALGLLNEHLNHCVLDAAKTGGAEAQEKLEEASQAIARLVRS